MRVLVRMRVRVPVPTRVRVPVPTRARVPVLGVTLAVLLAGCALAPPAAPSTPTAPSAAQECGQLAARPSSGDVVLWQNVQLEVAFTNCGSAPITLAREELCTQHGITAALERDGNTSHLLFWSSARASWPPGKGTCGDVAEARVVAPGETVAQTFSWNGTLLCEGCELKENEPMAPGDYDLVARARSEGRNAWEARAPMRLLPPRVPDFDANASIVFVLEESYHVGETVAVQARNVGNVSYAWNPFYAACALQYFHDDGRPFLVPPGTHCDVVSHDLIEPGQTVTLFNWTLDECVDDQWGCQEARPLPPGVYHLRGTFSPARGEFDVDRANGTRAGATLRIV